MNILLLTLISSSALNIEKFMWQFLQHLLNGIIQIFPTYSVSMPIYRHVHAMGMVKHQIRVLLP